jgi:hypothetical protein
VHQLDGGERAERALDVALDAGVTPLATGFDTSRARFTEM